MKAVILAAGRGERLRPISNAIPKPLIEIEGKTLIERSLDNLERTGIKEVIIVTGFLEGMIKEKLGNCYKGISISYISNKDYLTTGSMYSFSRAEGIIDEDIILLESDLLYDFKVLRALLDSPESNLVSIAPIRGPGDEVHVVVDESGYLVDLGKNIKDKRKSSGELVGINKLSPPFLKKMFEQAQKDYREHRLKYHYEETLFKASKIYPIKCLPVNDLIWTEIDTADDLEWAKEMIAPKLIK